MDFFKLNNYWCYQLTEWDNFDKEDMEQELSAIDLLQIEGYTMSPDSDIWNLIYSDKEFALVNDLVHGCEIRAYNENDLEVLEQLVKSFSL